MNGAEKSSSDTWKFSTLSSNRSLNLIPFCFPSLLPTLSAIAAHILLSSLARCYFHSYPPSCFATFSPILTHAFCPSLPSTLILTYPSTRTASPPIPLNQPITVNHNELIKCLSVSLDAAERFVMLESFTVSFLPSALFCFRSFYFPLCPHPSHHPYPPFITFTSFLTRWSFIIALTLGHKFSSRAKEM